MQAQEESAVWEASGLAQAARGTGKQQGWHRQHAGAAHSTQVRERLKGCGQHTGAGSVEGACLG